MCARLSWGIAKIGALKPTATTSKAVAYGHATHHDRPDAGLKTSHQFPARDLWTASGAP